jgi:tRNA-specific 2-thiouridylase
LLKGVDQEKDQSYFLYALNQYQLAHALFPIGDLKKNQVREIARKANLPNFAKKDSTGVCFIGERKFKDFLSEYLLAKPGDIVTTAGTILGKHDGLMFYTLGQRQGLKIGGQKNAHEAPWYVIDKDIKNNQLIVAQEHDHPRLLSHTLHCNQVHWISEEEPTLPLACSAKIRYRQQDQACTVSKLNDDTYRVDFTVQQRAITPGQSVVFYSGEECLGGGIITTKN